MLRRNAFVSLAAVAVLSLLAVFADAYKTTHAGTPVVNKTCEEDFVSATGLHTSIDAIDNGSHESDDIYVTCQLKIDGSLVDTDAWVAYDKVNDYFAPAGNTSGSKSTTSDPIPVYGVTYVQAIAGTYTVKPTTVYCDNP